MSAAEGILERVVQHSGRHVEERLHRGPVPAHLLGFVHAPGNDLVHRAFHKQSRDRLTASPAGVMVDQRRLVVLEVAEQVGGELMWTALKKQRLFALLRHNLGGSVKNLRRYAVSWIAG